MKPRALAISAQISPSMAGGVESNLLSMLRSHLWSDIDVDLVLLATPAYARSLADLLESRLRVIPWQLGEDILTRHFPGEVVRGRRIREILGPFRSAFDAAVRLYRVSRYGLAAPSEKEVDRVLAQIGVHAVHFPSSNLFRTNLPFIYEPWDLQFLHFPDFFDREELERRRTKYNYACENAAFIVAPTRWVKEDLISRLKVDSRKVVVIRRGSDFASTKLSDAQYTDLIRSAGVEPGFAFYPAMTFPHKNHLTLFRAIAYLKFKKGLTIRLVMTGRPYEPFAPTIERAIRDSGVSDQIRMLGPVAEAMLAALYRAAHAVVYPSLFEGLGLPLLEGLKHGAPVLAANATCIPEVLGRAGILFDPLDYVSMADAIEQAWRDREWVRRPLQYADEQLALFDWGEARKVFQALYRKVTGTRLRPEDHRLLQAV
jgi:glycosyltransferase involved in cell wall biosynthesis